MSYTFLSARYGNEESTAVVALTEEAGAVALSEADTPEAWAALHGSGLAIEPYSAPPVPALTRIAKADLWRRLTDEEAELLDTALAAAPLRLRRIFEAAQYLDTGDPDHPALRAGIVGALGEQRADEVMAPTY
ncbi:hypothetical protein [Bosea sp. (in: a-proteobacteria)]|uniref:hypothetical protein n=1 Tax=Bosea sp. (in: a-proteobacteria) TaxID=1871050 RepID=UPI0026336A81|nr:hypothetical protein [Bosea sp. (in: a-proteobacteria)]MCO5092679.1 hypothetical protein [Bosea sp. (in: a-proteobacteria)]